MQKTRQIIHQALDAVKVIDPHCHLAPNKPSANNLADILLYHHVWIELVSSGMPPFLVTKAGLPHELADPQLPPLERVRGALPYLGNIRNTTVGLLLRWLLQDLYGIESLNEQNLEKVFTLVLDRGRSPRWQSDVFARCGIEASISVEEGAPGAPGVFLGREALSGWLTYYGKHSLAEWLASIEMGAGQTIENAQDYREQIARSIQALPLDELKFVALFAPAQVSYESAHEQDVTRTLKKVKQRKPVDHLEIGGLAYFGWVAALDALRRSRIRTIQLLSGAELLPPPTVHRSLTHWGEGLAVALGRIAGQYEDFHFNVTTAADAHIQDVAILAKHVPNISVAGYWWHTLYPFYIRKSIETRLDMVPMTKIVMFFSDAYHSEWCYPKLRLVKQILEQVLAERVEARWYSLDLALEIIQKTFYDNPKAIYGV